MWKVASGMSINTALKQAEKEYFTYLLHLDDDDYWVDDRLEKLKNIILGYPDASFIFNYSTYCKAMNLPNINVKNIYYNNLLPQESNMVHSTFCWNQNMIKFRVETYDKDVGKTEFECGDIQQIRLVNNFIRERNYYCVFIPELLTFKEVEQEMLK